MMQVLRTFENAAAKLESALERDSMDTGRHFPILNQIFSCTAFLTRPVVTESKKRSHSPSAVRRPARKRQRRRSKRAGKASHNTSSI